MTPAHVVTLDGPAGAGKSTTAALLARELGWNFLNTGAMYRGLTLAAAEADVAADDEPGLVALARSTEISARPDGRLEIERVDRSAELAGVDRLALGRISALAGVRRWMVERQRAFREHGPLVGEGRDLGSVVFPDALLMVYLDASASVRAARRHAEMDRGSGDASPTVDEIREQILERDRMDSERVHAPLRCAADQYYLDGSRMSRDEVVARLKSLVADRLRGRETGAFGGAAPAEDDRSPSGERRGQS